MPCIGCGLCCYGLTLPISIEEVKCMYDSSNADIPSKPFVLEHWHPIEIKEGKQRSSWMKEIYGYTGHNGLFFYECDCYDKKTKSCKCYDERPEICSSFPYMDRRVLTIRNLPTGCGYSEDVLLRWYDENTDENTWEV